MVTLCALLLHDDDDDVDERSRGSLCVPSLSALKQLHQKRPLARPISVQAKHTNNNKDNSRSPPSISSSSSM